ncbi:hypothetical protein OG223_50775 [Streptomyces sp. NBC_01478]|uniref:hypothetical protein n=1 Tax=Streptomyces sp. NBC_01478 TaxID=2903882 RepID=UPI002E311683|nr:hypothetical protein [Streptomyces sp. NBC_01478]
MSKLTPAYGRGGSTTAYTWQIAMEPGRFAAPIQVVEPRWTKGVHHSTGKSCLPISTDIKAKPHGYTWDPDIRWGGGRATSPSATKGPTTSGDPA